MYCFNLDLGKFGGKNQTKIATKINKLDPEFVIEISECN